MKGRIMHLRSLLGSVLLRTEQPAPDDTSADCWGVFQNSGPSGERWVLAL